MCAFDMVVFDVLVDGVKKVAFAERDQPVQTR